MLIFSCLAIFIGVALVPLLRRNPLWLTYLDKVLMVLIGGLFLLQLLPHAFESIGFMCFGAALVGVAIPWLFERGKNVRFLENVPPLAVLVIVLALGGHALLDGAALSLGGDHGQGHGHGHQHQSLAWMILLHRLPVGLMLGLIGSARFKWLPWTGALWICVCTVLGFYLGESFMSALTETQEALFQSFVSGVILHVLFAHETKVESEPKAEDQSSSAP